MYSLSNPSVIQPLQVPHAPVWSGGTQQVLQWPGQTTIGRSDHLALDNHWVQLPPQL
ncbi:hypothetical protein [Comamonas aquatica]|uniref:hypothetical protein n=1 Tax=Comamonas aquatica TaxID=225991 RepID=UPI001E3140BF|nr:hypothetical protein [Comamonas aquatica]